jgi:excisionase family DNA binding protein
MDQTTHTQLDSKPLVSTYSGKPYNRMEQEAKRLGISIRHLRNLMDDRIVPFHKIRHTILFNPEKVDAALARYERTEKQ